MWSKRLGRAPRRSAWRLFARLSRRRREDPRRRRLLARPPKRLRRVGGGACRARPGPADLRQVVGIAAQPTRRGSSVAPPRRASARPRQAARDDLGHAVAAHADPVEDVGGVHRPFLVGDDDELGAVGEAADQLQEAVDVGVVERGLDLVEDVEGARPGEEDGEDEGQRDQRLLAAGEQRELAGRLAGRGDLDLDPELARAPPRPPPRRPRRPRRRLGRLLAAGRARRRQDRLGLGASTRRSRPRPPGKRCSTISSKFFAVASKVCSKARSISRSMSRISASSSRIARSMSSRWACSASTCSRASLVLALGQRVDRADLRAAALEALEPALDLGPLLVAQRPRSAGRISSPSRSAIAASSRVGLGAAVAEVGGLDLGLGQLVGGRLQLRLQLGLLLRAGAQLLGDLVAVALAADDRAPRSARPGARIARAGRGGRGERRRERRRAARSPAATRCRERASRWRSPSSPSARRAWRAARSAPSRTARRARVARRLGGVGGARRRPSARRRAERRPASISSPAPPRACGLARRCAAAAPTSSVSGPSSARGARARPAARPRGRRAPRRAPRAAPARRAAWSAGPRPGCARGRARRSAPRPRAALCSTSARLRLELVARGARLRGGRLRRRRSPPSARSAAPRASRRPQLQLLALDPRIELGRLGLALQRPQPRARLALDVERAVEVVAGRAQLQLGAAAALAVLAEARPPPRSAGAARAASSRTIASTRPWLITECISRPRLVSESDLGDVGEAAAGAVEPVAARRRSGRACARPRSRRTRCAARPSELSITTSTSAARRWPTPLPPAEITSCIDCAADRQRALLAERPEDRVGDVGLAGAVGPDDHADARRELQAGPLGEGLEALHRDRLQMHARQVSGREASRLDRTGTPGPDRRSNACSSRQFPSASAAAACSAAFLLGPTPSRPARRRPAA